MAGLYDGIDPQTALLLGLGSGLLGTQGQGRRASFGEALANGMQQGTAGYRQAIGDRQRAEQMQLEQQAREQTLLLAREQMKLAQTENTWKVEDRARGVEQTQRMQSELMKIDPTGRLLALYKLDPKAAAEQVFPKGVGVKDIDARELSPAALEAYRANGRLAPGDLSFKPKIEIVNGVAVDMSAMTPGQVAPQNVSDAIIRGADGKPKVNELAARAKNPSDPFYLSGNGAIAPNQPVQDFLMRKAAAGATRVSTNVNTEKTYAGNVAEGLAKYDVSAIDAARGASPMIDNAQRIKQLVGAGGVTTGPFASQRQAIDKALSTAGLVDGARVVNTEALVGELANQTMNAIKGAGLGSGQGFTDKDLQFVERAKSGNLEMTPQNIYRVADLNERAARASLKQGRSVAERLKGNPTMGSVGQSLEFNEPPAMKPMPLPPGRPTASNLLTGATYEIPGKGAYRWDGFNFEVVK